jgi:hypothetical protein
MFLLISSEVSGTALMKSEAVKTARLTFALETEIDCKDLDSAGAGESHRSKLRVQSAMGMKWVDLTQKGPVGDICNYVIIAWAPYEPSLRVTSRPRDPAAVHE